MAIDKKIVEILPAVRMILSDDKIKVAKIVEVTDASIAQIRITSYNVCYTKLLRKMKMFNVKTVKDTAIIKGRTQQGIEISYNFV